ncbi:MFS transporter [Actinomadura verrucosospora]|uniref:alpha-amylase n=1 Tax=Actinomadura verrucosospora TaxID=46165 RepID=A0A7D3W1B1_ACTVE|nr:MFS transporter [Actinomadura verrucosospora]QKG26818.1 membrane transport protein [Actinomadura verrucosospora]
MTQPATAQHPRTAAPAGAATAGRGPALGMPAERGSGLLIAVLAFAGIVVAVMQTLLIPVIGQLPQLLHTSLSNATWAMTATLLSGAVATPIMGRLGDLYGKKRMTLVSIGTVVVGSLVAAVSSELLLVVAGRAIQGFAMGAIPLGIGLMRDSLPRERLGSALALMSSSIGVGGALGLPVAAYIAQHFSWHMLFYGAAALGAVSFVLVLFAVPESKVRAQGRFDIVGTIGLTVGLLAVLLPITKGGDWGWTSPRTLGLAAAGVAILVLWGVVELRLRDPLIDLRTTARRQVLLTNLAAITVGVSFYAMSLVFPQLLELPKATGYGLGQSLLVAGLTVAPMGIAMMLVSPLSARVSAAFGAKTSLILGMIVIGGGYGAAQGLMNAVWQVGLVSAIVGAGIGLAYSALPTLILGAVDPSESGAANGVNTLMRSIGTSVSSALLGTVLARNTVHFGGAEVPDMTGFRISFVIATGAIAIGVLLAAFLPSGRRAVRHAGRPAQPAASGDVAADVPVAAPVEAAAPSVPDAAVPSGGPAVRGRVLRPDGTPLPGATVTLIDATGRQLGVVASDADGGYAIAVPAPGGYVLVGSAQGHQPEAATVTVLDAPADADLVLGGIGGLAGTVVDEAGEPVAGAVAVATDQRGEVVASAETGADGAFALADLAPGGYTLTVSAAGRRPAARPVRVEGGDPALVEIELPAGPALRGTVRGRGGEALGDAHVSLVDQAGNVVATARTGPDGAYAFEGLAPEDYTVVASGYPPVAVPLDLSGAGRDDFDIALSHRRGE